MENNQENELLINVLKKLDFFSTSSSIENDFPEIVFTKNPPLNLHPKHYIALEFAEILEADAVYFKYYDDNRFCVPQVYFYDNEINRKLKEEIEEIHKRVYSSCQVPIICFINETSITIRDCREPIKNIKNSNLVDNKKAIFDSVEFKNIDSLKSYFSAKKLNFGFIWENEKIEKCFTNNQSAYEKLVKVLTKIREEFIGKSIEDGISESIANDLLFKCILIKYLEENGKNENKDENFAKDFYHKNKLNFDSLKEILYGGKLLELLESLEKHFNGNVFKINSKAEINFIKNNVDLKYLAECLEGNLDLNNQLTIWQVYSFKDIPIELISNFYEEFINKEIDSEKGTVYTPSFLVNLLIDESLPILLNRKENDYNLKIIDVSCGSGIFISSAFKRLVQRYRIKESENNKPIPKEKLQLEVIKKILSQNIFGVDKNESATKLTNFSLQLALCQIVPNNQLWNWTKGEVFDNLENNIIWDDFFKFITKEDYKSQHKSFDLVIGNPPFIKYNKEKAEELKSIEKDLIKNNINISVGNNSKNQIALTFLDAMMTLSKPEIGKVCQIIPSGELLYFQDSHKFRKPFFSKYNIPQIFDFTLLRRTLFSESSDTTVPVLAIFVENKKPTEDNILHITFRRTKETQKKLYFELDYYDFYEVSKEISLNTYKVWQSNLFGGIRTLGLYEKLNNKEYKRLDNYLIENKINHNNYNNLKIKNNLLVLWKSISKSSFPYFIETNNESKITNENITFHAIKKEKIHKLKEILLLNRNIFNAFIAINADRLLYRPFNIFPKDILKIPFHDKSIPLKFSEQIIVDDIVKFRIEELTLGENAPINFLIEFEIAKSLDFSKNPLLQFAEIFNQSFNSIYKKDDKEQRLRKLLIGNDFYALEFYYSNECYKTKIIDNAEFNIEEIIRNNFSRNVMINRVLKIYGENTITLIKPKNLRFWLKSIALRDADDFFDDMIKSGY